MEAKGAEEYVRNISGSDGEQGILFRLDYDIIEDIPAEIEEFVRLSRLGLIIDARNLFHYSLKEHLNLFPVFAEFADFLLDQDDLGAVNECSKLLKGYLESDNNAFLEDEVHLLQLWSAFSDLRIRGGQAREFAVNAARSWHQGCERTDHKFNTTTLERDEVEIQGLEIYLAIIADTYRMMPTWLEKVDYFLPGTQDEPTAEWDAFRSWCHILNEEQRPWEAQKVLKSLLKVLDAGSMHQFYSEYVETLSKFNQGDAYSFSRIAAANSYVAVSLEKATAEALPDRVRFENKEAHSLLLLFKNQGALRGRHFEKWEENCALLQRLYLFEPEEVVTPPLGRRKQDVVIEAWAASDTLPASAVEALMRLLQDNDFGIRSSAADALGRQTTLPASAVEALIRLLQDDDFDVQSSAADVLGRQTTLPASAVEALIRLLQDDDSGVRSSATGALDRQTTLSASAVEAIVRLLQDNNSGVRSIATDALDRQTTLSGSTVETLVRLLQDDDSRVRSSAVDALGRQTTLPASAVEALVRLLQDDDSGVRSSTADALGRQTTLPASAVETLMRLLQDDDFDVRLSAADALVKQTTLPASTVEATDAAATK